jgi:diguanylate cyclase (GGDEF)-like protein
MLHHAVETRQPLSLLLIDLDHFKRVNDEFGHMAGDECLRMFARSLEDCLAAEAAVTARYGGEEFVVLLPGMTPARAREVAEKIRHRIGGSPVRYGGKEITMTASLGVCSLVGGATAAADDLLHQADDALYAAKNAGRNRVHAA